MDATTVQLTPILVALVGGAFSVIAAVGVALVNKYVKDATARTVLDNAVTNSVGMLQQVATGAVQKADIRIPGVPAAIVPAVQYVLNHAGEEASRVGVSPQSIAEKVQARLGLAEVATNLAATANSATPDVVPPLTAVAPAATPPKLVGPAGDI